MVPATATQQFIVIPDNAFTPYVVPNNERQHVYLELRPKKQYVSELIIAPHHHEAWLNIHLFKIALYCRKNNIKLIAIGHENQLPFFGVFADAVILQRAPLDSLFGWFSTFGADVTGFDKLPGWQDVYALTPWDTFCAPSTTIHDAANYPSVWHAIYAQYSSAYIIAAFSDCRIFIRDSSLAAFHSLNKANKLPKNAIWCEVKESYGKLNGRLALLRDTGLPIVGLDKVLQRNLVSTHGSHFMSLQILTSLFNNCKMILGAGSSHVFTVAPACLVIALGPDLNYDAQTEHVVQKIHLHRTGYIPYTECAELPYATTSHPWQYEPDADKSHIARCQTDYFLDENVLRGYIQAALSITPKLRTPITAWEDYLAEPTFDEYVDPNVVQFMRRENDAVTPLRSCTLNADGRLTPNVFNEAYWQIIAGRLLFKNQLGQVTTEFTPESKTQLLGKFIYNDAFEHVLATTPI